MCDTGNLQRLLKAEVGKPLVSLNSFQGTKMRKQNQSPGLEPHFYFLRVGSKNQLSGVCCHPAFSEHCQIRGGECGTSEGSNVLGRCCSCLCWQASWPYPSTSPVLETTSQTGWKRHCGSASQMMGLSSVPYFSLEYLVRNASPA